MIERLADKNDIRKLESDKKFKEILEELNNSDEYLEIVEDKFIFLGIRPKKGREVLQIDDIELLSFLRLLRDDFFTWKELVSIRKSAHKQFYQKFVQSNFFTIFSNRIEKATMSDSMKLTKKIHSIKDKIESIHHRLQGVFLVHGKKKEIIASMDTKNCFVITKINPSKENYDFSWIKDLRSAKMILFAPDDKDTLKSLKTIECTRLQISRKKSKNIWIKNHK